MMLMAYALREGRLQPAGRTGNQTFAMGLVLVQKVAMPTQSRLGFPRFCTNDNQKRIEMRKIVMTLAALAALGLVSSGAEARSGVKVGVLSCGIAGGVGLILGSSKKIDCVYQPSGGGRPEHYAGRINKFGVDIGITNQSVVVWAVFAPGKVNKGGLQGTYVGATAEATVALGLGANALIGGFKRSVGLQPLSVQAQTGLNVAAGVADLTLHYQRKE
jgi:hypothetical protein